LITSTRFGNECRMKHFVAALVLACPFVARAAKLELEVGTAHTLAAQPRSLTARIGLDIFGHLTPSVRVLARPPIGGDHDVWALLGELRAHTGGRVQLTAGLGVAVGAARVVRTPREVATVRIQRMQPTYVMGDLGLRLMLGDFWLGGGVVRSTGWDGYLATLSVGWAPLKTGR
jgi:hypothetical protein